MLLPNESPDRTLSIAAICLAVFGSIFGPIAIVNMSGCESKIRSAAYDASKAESDVKKTAIEKGYVQDRNGYWVKNNDKGNNK